ncbi:sigma-70 family RNA polymerase sigma factor [Paenibacillus sp. SC116]|uniref:sigma-70 family RNA polymerase sigma factor n=1 Tax=Paenibacillus sp. SC116 TaxID=2968986 RepID=UPI00215A51AD|nr:sigma-70 family RNA polymerase sigma factor [Paenibacillus sp. SC116]MCR8842457.1 sigma-70 family RNA polymerase sigma factor [Paenibacillus sp. SC116]
MIQRVEEAKRGSAEAYDELVKHFSGMAIAVAYEKLHDLHLAEDAVQEAFVEAFVNLQKLQDPRRFPGWFKVIVERQCYRYLRRKSFHTSPFHELELPSDNQESLEAIVERRELFRTLHATVADLPSHLRIAVQLYYFQGYSVQEISDTLEISSTALKKRLFDARKKLKNTLHVADLVSVFTDLYEGGTRMLHIVNGDVVADKLRQGNMQGEILVWRELYPFGPVFKEMGEFNNRELRAKYLERTLGIPASEYIRIAKEQEQKLHQFQNYDEVVLWFEHDLFDQTMLSYLLNWFNGKSLGKTKLNLLCIGSYPGIQLFRGLGQLSTEQLETLSGTWTPIGGVELELGSRAWEAYAAEDPNKMIELLVQDTSALPFLRHAFEAHLARLPSELNGLGIIEQFTLETIASGIHTPIKVFQHVGDRLHELGMGDLEYWYILNTLIVGQNPLLKVKKGIVPFADLNQSSLPFHESVLQLTALAEDVLEGKIDYTDLEKLDKWVGGIHLQGAANWRWDSKLKLVVKA